MNKVLAMVAATAVTATGITLATTTQGANAEIGHFTRNVCTLTETVTWNHKDKYHQDAWKCLQREDRIDTNKWSCGDVWVRAQEQDVVCYMIPAPPTKRRK